jgi:FkbM family methyltransferase
VITRRVKLRHWNRYFFNLLGFQIEKIDSSASVVGFLKYIKKTSLTIDCIYDVGAYKGFWSARAKKYFGGSVQFFLFEPNSDHNAFLTKVGSPFFNVLLGDKDNKTVDFFSLGLTGDSYFKEKNPLYDDSHSKPMILRSLDQFIFENSLPSPDLLKLDTQGSELAILRGASKTLRSVKVLIIEVPISNYNSDAPNINEYLQILGKFEFVPVAVTEIHKILGTLVQIDLAFLSKAAFLEIHGHADFYSRKA